MRERMEVDPVTVVADTQVAPSVIQAWSEEDSGQWRTPTMGYHLPNIYWRKLLVGSVKYLAIPVVAVVVALSLTRAPEAPQQQQEGPKPAQVKSDVTMNPAPAPNPNEDDRFLDMVVASGQRILDRDGTIASARWVCAYMAQGRSEQDAVKVWDADPRPGVNPQLDHKANQDLADAAIKVYCPQFS